ncbi:MAG: hypothetical protein A2Z27_00160 [candidate division Zixibacteria bacterium RBG_16_50_21]|nr:MAG: hypothetical protein A2Z27_00160 [candidate division Zixibacteria bacterium RBG_16_50_21]
MSVTKGILTFALLLLPTSLVWSGPVLVKIDFIEEQQVDLIKKLGGKAYQRFDNSFVVVVEDADLNDLDRHRVSYEILDENPWTDKYFIVSTKRGDLPKLAASYWGSVLIDGARWKFVKLTPTETENLRGHHLKLVEMKKQEIPLKFVSPEMTYFKPPQIEGQIAGLADSVSQDSLYSFNLRLQNFQTRFVVSDSCTAAAVWLMNKFKSFGIDSVYLDTFYYFDWVITQSVLVTYNVVAVVKGKVNQDKTIVVGGHYDSVVWGESPGPMVWAPGADDNGSGTAATLEIARLVAKDTLDATVTFVCFSGEELGLYGSYDYAYKKFNEGKDIQFMLNMDMVGYAPNQSHLEVQKDLLSFPYARYMAGLSSPYSLAVVATNAQANSDHWPFMEVGYPAVFAAEYIFNYQGWHQNTDIVDSMNFEYMARVVRLAARTVENLGTSPRPVEGLRIVDDGTGGGVYVSWNHNRHEGDIQFYMLYFGTNPNQLSAYDFFTDTTVHLQGLSEGTTYYVGVIAFNNSFKESPFMNLRTAVSFNMPRSPSNPAAKAALRSVQLSWSPNPEVDLVGYRVYRSTVSGGPYQHWAGDITDTTYTDTSGIQGGIRYYYVITATDTSGYESGYSQEASSAAVTLDQGVLVLDETAEILGYGDDVQDSFFNALFQDYKFATFDYSGYGEVPDLGTLGPHNVVVWLDDDYYTHQVLDDTVLLKDYLEAGGKLLISSWNSFQYLPGGLPRSFVPGEFIYDYLKISSATKDSVSLADFQGASGEAGLGYPGVTVDTSKPTASWNGILKHVAKLGLRPEAELIYYYDSKNDRTGYEGEICGLRYMGNDYDLAFLSFPIFYLNFADAQTLVAKVMTDFGIPTPVEPHKPTVSVVPKEFQLGQNYPNPFNPSTTMKYSLPEAAFVKLEIFNILGQRVKTLVETRQGAGFYTVIWDGKNEAGENVSSGIYFYRLDTEKAKSVKKMVLLR